MKISTLIVSVVAIVSSGIAGAKEASITFDGRYEYRTDAESQEVLGRQVCFFPSGPSSRTIPRPAGDHRAPWFCFRNSEQAAHLFGFDLNAHSNECGVTGTAKVRVSKYSRYTGEGNDNDVATLGVVMEKSKPAPLFCSK